MEDAKVFREVLNEGFFFVDNWLFCLFDFSVSRALFHYKQKYNIRSFRSLF